MAVKKQVEPTHLGPIVQSVTTKGGSVMFNEAHGVWASYAVAGCGDEEPRLELFYAGIKLPDGRNVLLFVNRENGLVVVDVVNKDQHGGIEIFRKKV